MRFIDTRHDAWAQALPGHRLLTLAQWVASRDEHAQLTGGAATGLLLANDADMMLLEADLPRLAIVVLQFPKWTDGRAYSQARLLRSRLRFAGEIRATGEVLVDMLPLLQRTGFDSVELHADQSLSSAERALRFFSGHYQGDVAEPRPVFARQVAPQV